MSTVVNRIDGIEVTQAAPGASIKTRIPGVVLMDPTTGLPSAGGGGGGGGGASAGDVAHDAADSGNPVKIGGKASDTTPALVAAGDRVNAWLSRAGAQFTVVTDTNGQQVLLMTPAIDGQSVFNPMMPAMSFGMAYNPAADNWARVRGDTTGLFVNTAYEKYSAITILEATTSGSDGTAWTAFASQTCTGLDVVNNTDVDIEYRRNGAGNAMTIKTGHSRFVQGITNANQIAVRRKDTTATAVVVEAESYNP